MPHIIVETKKFGVGTFFFKENNIFYLEINNIYSARVH